MAAGGRYQVGAGGFISLEVVLSSSGNRLLESPSSIVILQIRVIQIVLDTEGKLQVR